MDNWKIQLVVVTFCALVQTYQAVSSSAEEERGIPQDWQVSFLSSETRENMDKYDLLVVIAEIFSKFSLGDSKYLGF